MRVIDGFFDKLYFTESILGPVGSEGTSLRVPVEGLFVLGGHPLEVESRGPYRGELVFDNVTDSRRTLVEYIGDSRKPDGYREPYQIVDDLAGAKRVTSNLQRFTFEGYQTSPSAWVGEWSVTAASFSLCVT
jgi:hypothetical protein